MRISIKNLMNSRPELPNDFIIDRRSPLGNPYFLKNEGERNKVIEGYRQYFLEKVGKKNQAFMRVLKQMVKAHNDYGQINLFCWCYPKRCHGEVIKEYLEEVYGQKM